MRLFTGLEIPAQPKQELDRLLQRFRPLAPALRWSAVENLHVTTKFVGEWPQARLGELTAALGAVPKPGPVEVRLSGLGWFPNPHQPRIFWVSVKAAPSLAELAGSTEEHLADALGIPAETRAYTPHLTLARVAAAPSTAVDLAPLRREVAGLATVEFGQFEARAFHLYLSEPQPGGASRYTKLSSFPLAEGNQ